MRFFPVDFVFVVVGLFSKSFRMFDSYCMVPPLSADTQFKLSGSRRARIFAPSINKPEDSRIRNRGKSLKEHIPSTHKCHIRPKEMEWRKNEWRKRGNIFM